MNILPFLGIILFLAGAANSKGIFDGIESIIDKLKNGFKSTLSTITAIPRLIPSLKRQKNSPNTASEVKAEYDYVIIGAGSAGSVLANRLSANPCVRILLLEAGSAPPILTEIPAIERFFVHSSIDWDFDTVPQNRSGRNLNNQRVKYASGKVLGGSSLLNDVQYSRGNPQDYDDWASMGATGWNYSEVYPYFIKLEDNRDPEFVANGYHGVGGPQTISRPRYYPELKKHLFDAFKSLNIPSTDANSPRQLGVYDAQGTLRDGQMCSTAKAYLAPVDYRTNLDIIPKAFVTKIRIEKNRATGVQFEYKSKTRMVTARKEVLLSAGTINTPKLLMLSGIGPAKELQKHKISVVADLPGVGQNLQDHVGGSENFIVNNTVNVGLKLANPLNAAHYVDHRTGPFSAAQLVIAVANLQNKYNPKVNKVPDHQMYFVELASILPLLDFNLKLEVFIQIYLKYIGSPFYGCLVHILHPRSRGSVTLKSKDPHDPPLIDTNYFEDPKDVRDIVEALKDCNKVSNTPAMKSIGAKRFETRFPGCEKYANDTDKYYECQVVSAPLTFYHYAGTAKMGNPDDPMTVVDPQLRVKGVKGLRVIDSSVMPKITSGNTNIPTIMIAEKASDMIASTFNCQNYDPSLMN